MHEGPRALVLFNAALYWRACLTFATPMIRHLYYRPTPNGRRCYGAGTFSAFLRKPFALCLTLCFERRKVVLVPRGPTLDGCGSAHILRALFWEPVPYAMQQSVLQVKSKWCERRRYLHQF